MELIVLYGFMGAGKSTLGPRVADLRKYRFVDLDEYIEKRLCRNIPEIFEEEGEAFFREQESASLTLLLREPSPKVVALGGGTVLCQKNREILRSHGARTVYLQAEPWILCERLTRRQSRPLLKGLAGEPLFNRVSAMMEERRAVYESFADYRIDTSHESPEESLEKIGRLIDFC